MILIDLIERVMGGGSIPIDIFDVNQALIWPIRNFTEYLIDYSFTLKLNRHCNESCIRGAGAITGETPKISGI